MFSSHLIVFFIKTLPLLLFLSFAQLTYADTLNEARVAYEKGDYTTALKILRPLAEKGDAKAQHNLGLMYHTGEGVTQDHKEAVKWFRKAADQGLPEAQLGLAEMYLGGLGVTEDPDEGVNWVRKAAEQGLLPAQFALGRFYQMGIGVAKDFQQALKWYREVAEKGQYEGQVFLGMMYAEGEGIKRDPIEAYAWLHLAAVQEDQEDYDWLPAQWSRDGIAGEMTTEQINEARKLAMEYAKEIDKELVSLLLEVGKLDLMECASAGNFERAAKLIDEGADINERDRTGATPLMRAIHYGSHSVARLLIASGAEVNVTDHEGNTPLLFATTYSVNTEIVEILISEDADIDVKNKKGDTPLKNMASIADLHRHGSEHLIKDIDEAIKWYRLAAKHGDVYSQNELKQIASE